MDTLTTRHTPTPDPVTPGACRCGLPLTATSNARHQPDGDTHVLTPVIRFFDRRRPKTRRADRRKTVR